MRVLVEAESEVAKRIGGVARLLERTQHEVGKDALLGLAGDLFGEALVVLRGDVEVVAARELDFHGALAAVAVGVRATGARGGGRDRDGLRFGAGEIFDAERIAEGVREFFEFEDLLRGRAFRGRGGARRCRAVRDIWRRLRWPRA